MADAAGNWTLNPLLDVNDVATNGGGTKQNVWYVVPSDGGPGPRLGQGCVQHHRHVIFFGGADPASQYNDIYTLDTANLQWARLCGTVGAIPSPRYEMALALVNVRDPSASGGPMLVVFGGASATGNFNDVHSCDLHTGQWTLRHPGATAPNKTGTAGAGISAATPSTAAPSPRTLHHAPVVQGPGSSRLYVFGGGEAGATPVADSSVHALNLVDWTWTTCATTSSATPSPRQGHTLTALGPRLFLFGGMGPGALFNDLWVFDTETHQWEQPETSGDEPNPRSAHTAVALQGKLYVAGGLGFAQEGDVTPQPLDDMWELNPSGMRWRRIAPATAPFTARLSHCMCAVALHASESTLGDAPDGSDQKASVGDETAPPDGIVDVTSALSGPTAQENLLTFAQLAEAASAVGEPLEPHALLLYGGMDGNAIFEDCLVVTPDGLSGSK
eukprot:m.23139 g.23139  ORF g.23139 m.23139 type:complete len:444 (-) comp12908_c0_seq4:498-1829(-)